ncbi:MAG: hypothetical protein F6J97_24130 [Leptolyngbya sp. SIO4C1]|nr:hypothetical protein [Leptolyngbya sp. SIO4C1]
MSSSKRKEGFSTQDRSFLSYPGVPLPIGSPLYINREPTESRALAELQQPGGLIRLKGPDKIGKTSLLFRLLQRTQGLGYAVAVIDLQQAEAAVLSDLDRLLRWLCSSVSYRLGLPVQPKTAWPSDISSKLSCSLYFQEQVLRTFDTPVLLCLRQVDRLFDYPQTAQEFFPMLRGWFEDARWLSPWQKLRLALVYSTDFSAPLKLNQSPFNVGVSFRLPVFTRAQVEMMAQRYALDSVTTAELDWLMTLLGGHPYLVAIAFYHLAINETTWARLRAEASNLGGLYDTYLRRHWQKIQANPVLLQALQQVLSEPGRATLDASAAYQLEGLGVINLIDNQPVIAGDLYRQYFQLQLQQLAVGPARQKLEGMVKAMGRIGTLAAARHRCCPTLSLPSTTPARL